ncbi:hypothetical protein [Plantactinospora sp. KLBMP9567]|uniref:hypothetical protein n=1 Tax=Plantactinospora sp. KLBMP9567 TaxID=3085900 RepID=UPI0029822799|nr:hypothetical protein [Plantactinospora sp. KLBMP9567]MDW5326283.1 hypothetical protein [Plantactinospora sp. KLBMP9567]
MTDDATTPAADDDAGTGSRYGSDSPGRAEPASRAGDVPPGAPAGTDQPTGQRRPPDAAARRRRRLTIAGIAGAAVLVLLVCGCLGAFAAGLGRFARESDRERTAQARGDSACRELERRLNRLTPPGATGSPGARAAAIRDENAAVRPFLSEIERLRGWWGNDRDDPDDDRGGRGESWQRLVDARASYADALDRQVTNGEPAFFIAPRDPAGRPVVDRLQHGPEECASAARRLGAPDL